MFFMPENTGSVFPGKTEAAPHEGAERLP